MAEVRSGSFNTGGYADSDPLYADYCIFSWSLQSQDIEKATSTITWTLKGAGGSGGYYTTARERYVTVNGSTQSATNLFNIATGTTVFSGTTVVQHNTTTGAGSFSASAGIAFYYYPSYNSTGSGTWSLPTIARATKITVPQSATMGNTIQIALTPAVSTYKHKLRYEFGSLKSQIDGFTYSSGAALSADFTPQGSLTINFVPPTSLGWEIPNTTSGNCKVICYTYNASGTHIGTTEATVTLNLPAYTPNISLITLTGVNTLSGEYVAGKSSVTIKTSAQTSYGGSIKSYSATIDGKVYSGANFTTGVLTAGSSRTFTITVYDSRGKSASKTSAAINVYAYAAPSITTFTIKRDTTDPTKAIATLKGGVYSLNKKNAKTFTVKLNGVTNTLTSTSESIDTTTTFTNVPTDNTLIATATITDSYSSVSREAILPTVAVTMDFLANGKGVAFGKVAETSDLLDIAWKTKHNKAIEISDNNLAALTLKRNHGFNGSAIRFQNDSGILGHIGMSGNTPDGGLRRWSADTSGAYFILDTGNLTTYIKDYVIEQGTSGGWNYTKWNNGRIELYGDKSLTFPAGTTVATVLNRSITTIDLSGLLTDIISGNCPIQYNGMIPQFCRHTTYRTRAEIVIVTNRSIDGFTITVPIYVIGKWK